MLSTGHQDSGAAALVHGEHDEAAGASCLGLSPEEELGDELGDRA